MADADIIEGTVGPMGCWQVVIVLLLFIGKLPIGFVATNIIFIAPKQAGGGEEEEGGEADATRIVADGHYLVSNAFEENVFKGGVTFIPFGDQTLVTEFDLTGDNEYLMFLCQMVVMLGILIGSYLFGNLADLFGRKLPLIISVVLIIVAKFCQALIPNLVIIMIVRFIAGLGCGGLMVITWVLTMEICGKKYREALTVIYHIFFLLSYLFSLLFLFLVENWRDFVLFQGLIACIMLLYICLVPESPRWLITKKKTDKAVAILEKGSKRNKKDAAGVEAKVKAQVAKVEGSSKGEDHKYTLVDLFRGKHLRFNTIGVCLCWVSVSLDYYGLVQYLGQSSDNFYVSISVSTGLQIISTIITFPIMKFVGRRATLLISNIICAIAMILCVVFTPGSTISEIVIIVGVLGINFSWTAVYLYSTELFPTVVRSSGMGLASTLSRVGGLVAPLVIMSKGLNERVPFALFAIFPICAFVFTIFLPETLNTKLPETLEDAEEFHR